jgi:hypothetical protein
MAQNTKRPDYLRLSAAAILGFIIGTILFLFVALAIGVVNDRMGMQIPISFLVAENIFSAILLVLFILISIAVLCWQVWNTPSSDEGL